MTCLLPPSFPHSQSIGASVVNQILCCILGVFTTSCEGGGVRTHEAVCSARKGSGVLGSYRTSVSLSCPTLKVGCHPPHDGGEGNTHQRLKHTPSDSQLSVINDKCHSVGGNVNWCSLYVWKTIWSFLKKLKIELPYDPAIPLLGIYPHKTTIQKYACTPVFIAALFTIAKTWRQPNCPLTDEQIKKMWCVCVRAHTHTHT